MEHNKKFDEVFYGYLIDEEGCYSEPVRIETEGQLRTFICDNVQEHHELRVVDSDDCVAYQIINQTLIFPIPDHGSVNNHWDEKTMKFVTIDNSGLADYC